MNARYESRDNNIARPRARARTSASVRAFMNARAPASLDRSRVVMHALRNRGFIIMIIYFFKPTRSIINHVNIITPLLFMALENRFVRREASALLTIVVHASEALLATRNLTLRKYTRA